jgi:H+-translocating NAD(P) transhydrogenase subunit alpha
MSDGRLDDEVIMTTVGVLRETAGRERRVALTPDAVGRLRRLQVDVLVESGAGSRAWFEDSAYTGSGAEVVPRLRVYAQSDVLLCLHPPDDLAAAHAGQLLIGLLGRGRAGLAAPATASPGPGAGGAREDGTGADAVSANAVSANALSANAVSANALSAFPSGVTAISLDRLPRTLSRAQSMDALTSQANVAGYKAALLAAEAYPGFFPMLMTAAGTTRPAQVLVLGAGVAGLQAIATSRRLGAQVTGYDVRDAARADIASTGAAVLDVSGPDVSGPDVSGPDVSGPDVSGPDVSGPSAEAEGGYARGLTDDEAETQLRGLTKAIPRFDVVITTAQVPGRRAPLLVTAEAIAGMRPGSVVLDLAAAADGGNVEGSVPDTRTVTDSGVTVIGAAGLASTVPGAASTAYARNLLAVLAHLMPRGEVVLDLADEITRALLVPGTEDA